MTINNFLTPSSPLCLLSPSLSLPFPRDYDCVQKIQYDRLLESVGSRWRLDEVAISSERNVVIYELSMSFAFPYRDSTLIGCPRSQSTICDQCRLILNIETNRDEESPVQSTDLLFLLNAVNLSNVRVRTSKFGRHISYISRYSVTRFWPRFGRYFTVINKRYFNNAGS